MFNRVRNYLLDKQVVTRLKDVFYLACGVIIGTYLQDKNPEYEKVTYVIAGTIVALVLAMLLIELLPLFFHKRRS